jgi:hypothetical protein
MTDDLEKKSTQFQIKHVLAVLLVVSVWSAVMRQPKLRAYGDLLTVLILCFYSTSIIRFVGARIRSFAEWGIPSLASGFLAATIGSFAALVYGSLLVDAFRNGEPAFAPSVMGLLGALVVLGFWLGGLLVIVALALLTLADLFRRPLGSFPLIFVFNLLHAAIGATMFVMFEAALVALDAKPAASGESYGSMGLLGGMLGFVFGSCGLHVHLDYAEEGRI